MRSACLQHRPGARVQLLDGAAQRAFTRLPGSARWQGPRRRKVRQARPDLERPLSLLAAPFQDFGALTSGNSAQCTVRRKVP